MKKHIIWLVIGCLLVIASGCNGKKAGQPAASTVATSSQNQPVVTVVGNTKPLGPLALHPQPAGPIAANQVPLAGALYAQVKIPVLMPSYWPPIPPSNNQNPYYGIQYSAGRDSYSVNITVTTKQLPVNSPELNMPPNDAEANQWGNFGGGRIGAPGASTPSSVVVQQPKDGQPSVIGGYQGWQDPVSFYWESGAWQCEVMGSGGSLMDDARSLTGSFKDAGELKSLQAKSGKILASDADHQHTFISWVSADGQYEYTLQYDGEFSDAIKIAGSFTGLQ